jgi:hypothetical protein
MEGRSMRQQTLVDGSFEKYRKKTRKELFLENRGQNTVFSNTAY